MEKSSKGLVIAIGGLSGSGKSTLAARLAREVGAIRPVVWISTDKIRKELWGVRETEPLPLEAYSPEYSSRVYEEVDSRTRAAAERGDIALVDAVFATEFGRSKVEGTAKVVNAGFVGLWLEAPVPVLKQRVNTRTNDASDANSKIVDLQSGFNIGRISWKKFDASAPVQDVYRQVKVYLEDKEGIFLPAIPPLLNPGKSFPGLK